MSRPVAKARSHEDETIEAWGTLRVFGYEIPFWGMVGMPRPAKRLPVGRALPGGKR